MPSNSKFATFSHIGIVALHEAQLNEENAFAAASNSFDMNNNTLVFELMIATTLFRPP